MGDDVKIHGEKRMKISVLGQGIRWMRIAQR